MCHVTLILTAIYQNLKPSGITELPNLLNALREICDAASAIGSTSSSPPSYGHAPLICGANKMARANRLALFSDPAEESKTKTLVMILCQENLVPNHPSQNRPNYPVSLKVTGQSRAVCCLPCAEGKSQLLSCRHPLPIPLFLFPCVEGNFGTDFCVKPSCRRPGERPVSTGCRWLPVNNQQGFVNVLVLVFVNKQTGVRTHFYLPSPPQPCARVCQPCVFLQLFKSYPLAKVE